MLENLEKIRVGIYMRISTDEEHQPYSLGAQQTKLHAYIQSQDNWKLAFEYSDQASGAKLERPELQRALRDAKAGKFDLLLVYRVDRFSRSVRGLAQLLEELAQSNVAFRSSTEPFDTTTAAGRMMVQMLAVFAEFERATIIDRVINGMERKAARGEWTSGQRPYGYTTDPKTHQLVVIEDEAPIVQTMFKLYAEKKFGTKNLAQLLTERGYRTRSGKPWSATAILRILRNRAYVGEIYFRGSYHQAEHVPLISQELFDEVTAILAERGEDHSKRQQAANPEYLLTGLVVCASCEKHYLGTSAKGNRYRYRYYSCYSRARYGNKTCAADRLPAHEVDQGVIKALVETYDQTDLFDRALAAAREQSGDLSERNRSELMAVTEQLRKTEASIERYLNAFEEGTLPESIGASRLEGLAAKAAELRQRKTELREALENSEIVPPSEEVLRTLRAQIAHTISTQDEAQQKRLLQALVHEIRVDGRKVTPVFRVPTVLADDPDERSREMTRLVGVGGLEPPRGYPHWHLKPARLPFRTRPSGCVKGSPISRPPRRRHQLDAQVRGTTVRSNPSHHH